MEKSPLYDIRVEENLDDIVIKEHDDRIEESNMRSEVSPSYDDCDSKSPKHLKHSKNEDIKYSEVDKYTPKQQKQLEEIISYLRVEKQPFDKQDLEKIFNRLDVDGDKKVSASELKKFLYTLRTPMSDYLIERIIRDFDKNNNGEIEFQEFYDKINSSKINEEDIKETRDIFQLFDANSDNYICHQDFLNVMRAMGENVNEKQCQEVVRLLADKDGKISMEKFTKLVHSDK